ncbi:hypothetical protein [Sphingomonas sanguinis]|uniref:hypothetical protein n=1 Tax=Sphingomonas sanguinis TaxID=33051 RepID=UPI000ADBB506|nr:hypothetical protein [Sphingomonas sanguinis]
MKGSLYFDWVIGDGISIVLSAGGRTLDAMHLSADEARRLARRLSQWQDYKDARGQSRPCRQPPNRMTVAHVDVRDDRQ